MKNRVTSNRILLEPCGLKDLNYQIDPYIGCEHNCHYCYAKEEAETDWTKEILIHDSIEERLEKELKDIEPQTIYLGYKTDPYQPCEVSLEQTKKVLEILSGKGFSASILTKSNLVLRDLDILTKMENPFVSVSLAFTEERTKKLFEANTICTSERISSLKKLKENGIKTGALICPVIPHITKIEDLIDLVDETVDTIWIYGLSVQDKDLVYWRNVHKILCDHYPDGNSEIEEIIFDKEHSYWQKLRTQLNEIKVSKNLDIRIHL